MTTQHGSTSFQIGQAGIHVDFDAPMPSDDYSLFIQPRDTAGYSTTADSTYFNPLKKTRTGFQIQHKTTKDGKPLPVDFSVPMDWIAVHA